jgi:uncharacterized membrane protein
MLLKMILFGCVGVALEVVFTALTAPAEKRSIRLLGYSYIWMLPIYATTPVLLNFLYPRLIPIWLPARLAVYVVVLFFVEYISGWILRTTTGTCPWEAGYRGHRWAIHGLVRLDFAPSWAVAAFILEKIYIALLPLPG